MSCRNVALGAVAGQGHDGPARLRMRPDVPKIRPRFRLQRGVRVDLSLTPAVQRALLVVAGTIVAFWGTRFLGRQLAARLSDVDASYRVRKLATALGVLLAAVVVLNGYEVKLQGLTVLLGVAGVGIAFALQEVIASVAGWVALTFSRFYGPGDRVQLGGIKGDVIDIGILRTTLMEIGDWIPGDAYNGRIVRVANSMVFKEPVYNYSADFPFLWDEMVIPIRHGSDRGRARALLTEVANAELLDYAREAQSAWDHMVRRYRLENARVEPSIYAFATDNWLQYTLRYVVDYRQRRAVKDRLHARVLDAIDATDGAVMLASATSEVSGWPPLRVELDHASSGGKT
jgi:small-conductance mechanosensitive channel